jgi:hypothetical protein
MYAAAIFFGGWILLASNRAHAEGAAARLHLRYAAARGCPSREDFLVALESRIQTSWVDRADTRSFDVRVVQRPDRGYTGRLEIHRPDRTSSVREIHDASCRAVTTSLAVFIAIAVDPASEPSGASGASGAESPETAQPEEEPQPKDELASVPALPTAPVVTRLHAPAYEAAPAERTLWTWSTGYALGHLHAPSAGWGGRLHSEVARGDERGHFIPALRASWGWSDFSTLPALAGKARFRLKSARLEGCVRFGLPPFVAATCAGVDVGTLTATTPELPPFLPVTTQWWAATGMLRAAWLMAPWLALELSAGVLAPFERHRFTVQQPVRQVYRAPVVLFEGSGGIAAVVRFR